VTASGATSPPSNVVTVTTPALPATPQNLTATAVSPTRVDLAWQDVSTDETHFKVERSTNGTSFSTVSWPTANTTVFVDNNRQSKTTYYYRVSSYNTNGTSTPSNVAIVTTP
jgi:fibronectin type 3 domain-containing protein